MHEVRDLAQSLPKSNVITVAYFIHKKQNAKNHTALKISHFALKNQSEKPLILFNFLL
jgi:hypothetical protein